MWRLILQLKVVPRFGSEKLAWTTRFFDIKVDGLRGVGMQGKEG